MNLLNVKVNLVHLIPNPVGVTTVISAQTGDFSINSDLHILFNNSLIVEISQGSPIFQLAKYTGGDSLSIIPNPDAGYTQAHGYPHTIFNGKLYIAYRDASIQPQLAECDGDSLKMIPTPTGYTFDFSGGFVTYKSKLYYMVQNNTTDNIQLAVFDGNTVSIIANPDIDGTVILGYSIAYKDNLFVYYLANSGSELELTAFNGNTFNSIPNLSNIDGVGGIPIIFNDNLYILGGNSSSGSSYTQILQYDGSKFTAIPNPANTTIADFLAPDNSIDWYPFIYNSQLCFDITNLTTINVNLGYYDGSKITVIENPTQASQGQVGSPYLNYPTLFNNKAYISYGQSLAEYNGAALKIVSDPDRQYIGPPVIYGNSLYLYYQLADFGAFNEMAKFNGTSTNVVANTHYYANHPIVYDGKLFGYYRDSTNTDIAYLGYLDTTSNGPLPVSLINFSVQLYNNNSILSWQTAQEENTNYFIIQRSLDDKHFNDINKVAAAKNSSSTKFYKYTDLNVTGLAVGKLYYRLQEVDMDGNTSYSKIQLINLNKRVLITISPNPIDNFINITSTTDLKNTKINLTDITGKRIYTTIQNLSANSQLQIPVYTLAKGTYVVTIENDAFEKQITVIKK